MTATGESVRPGRSRARVLLVEEEPSAAPELAELLAGMGYGVTGRATCTEQALALTEFTAPDLVLMDVCLEGRDDAVAIARALGERFGVPIVYVAVDTQGSGFERALQTEPAGFLAKPYTAEGLRVAIELGLRNHQAQRARIDALEGEKRRLREKSKQLITLSRALRRESRRDSLTGLGNRRHFEHSLARELSLLDRRGGSLALILIDLDGFKALNDSVGHSAGDSALRALGEFLLGSLRPYDIPCRIGGDEIAILVPRNERREAVELCDRLLTGILQLDVLDGDVPLARLGASFGCAVCAARGTEGDALYRTADACLYESKRRGGNCVTVSGDAGSSASPCSPRRAMDAGRPGP